MPGPLPKLERQRERDTRRRASEFARVRRDGVLRGPDIDEATGRDDWSDETRRWWDSWRLAPQAVLFEVTDWQRLALLAVLVEAFHRRPSAAAMSEIRMNEERLGATWGDRLRNRIGVDPAEDADVVELHAVPSGNDLDGLYDELEPPEESE